MIIPPLTLNCELKHSRLYKDKGYIEIRPQIIRRVKDDLSENTINNNIVVALKLLWPLVRLLWLNHIVGISMIKHTLTLTPTVLLNCYILEKHYLVQPIYL